MSLPAIINRIKEFESSHMVPGGTHFEGSYCGTCAVIKKLQGLKMQYENETIKQVCFNDKSHIQELSA